MKPIRAKSIRVKDAHELYDSTLRGIRAYQLSFQQEMPLEPGSYREGLVDGMNMARLILEREYVGPHIELEAEDET